MKYIISLSLCLSGTFALVSAASIPATIQLPKNNTFSEALPANNASTLTAITPPAGFAMRYTWDRSVSLRWIEEYVNTIEAMIRCARTPWDGFIVTSRGEISSPDFRSRLEVGVLRAQLQTKHLVSGLYEAGITIAASEDHGTRDFKLYAGIVLDNRPIGWLLYDIKRPRLDRAATNSTVRLNGSDLSHDLSTNPPEEQSPDSDSPTPLSTRRSGWVSDLADPKFKIYYESNGQSLTPSCVWTAFLDGFATAAQHDNDGSDADISARSSDRSVSINVHGDADAASFTWGNVKTTLKVIWREVVIGYRKGPDRQLWEDMTFLIYYEGKRVGEGYIVLL
ncbi:MAG: hypothetical protein ASARMPREDX12_000308 [Alectoria sarmentosa]|nr:MAG: hypothetical protein ASARMPREDX12_000308 [Alectoria sarmentosa]